MEKLQHGGRFLYVFSMRSHNFLRGCASPEPPTELAPMIVIISALTTSQ